MGQDRFWFVPWNTTELLDKPLAMAKPALSRSLPSARGMFSLNIFACKPPPATKIDSSSADLRRASGLALASKLKKLLRLASWTRKLGWKWARLLFAWCLSGGAKAAAFLCPNALHSTSVRQTLVEAKCLRLVEWSLPGSGFHVWLTVSSSNSLLQSEQWKNICPFRIQYNIKANFNSNNY